MKVVAYMRISRDAEDSTSIPRQRDITSRYAEARGWTVVETVEVAEASRRTAALQAH